jgi:hypothetical protein
MAEGGIETLAGTETKRTGNGSMLLSKPLQAITYQDLTEFCERWSEGTRVEYKQVLRTDHIPKVISSFANTVGGIWIIGVKTDESGRAITPIEGFPREPGVEERISQSCYQSLYPELLPDIRILDVPGNSNNVVVVVRVPESNEAPHAIENTTKVYIRKNSTTDRIDLAEIDRVEYLLKRRREAGVKRDDMLAKLTTYSRPKKNAIRIKIGPQYPHGPLLTRDLLTQRVKLIPGARISPFVHPIREGYIAPAPYAPDTFQNDVYFATNFHGMIVYEERLEKSTVPQDPRIGVIHLDSVTSCINWGLKIAKILLAETTVNLKLDVQVEGITKCTVFYGQGSNVHETGGYALDNTSSAEARLTTEQLNDSDFMTQLLVDLIYQLMWPFNWHNRIQIDHAIRGPILPSTGQASR